LHVCLRSTTTASHRRSTPRSGSRSSGLLSRSYHHSPGSAGCPSQLRGASPHLGQVPVVHQIHQSRNKDAGPRVRSNRITGSFTVSPLRRAVQPRPVNGLLARLRSLGGTKQMATDGGVGKLPLKAPNLESVSLQFAGARSARPQSLALDNEGTDCFLEGADRVLQLLFAANHQRACSSRQYLSRVRPRGQETGACASACVRRGRQARSSPRRAPTSEAVRGRSSSDRAREARAPRP
jgi:hypothetical protein